MARRKNRSIEYSESFTSKSMRWKLGKYIRLSKEDINRGSDDSNSVMNQKKLLDEYFETHSDEFISAVTYTDDGYTGTDTNRFGFQQLIADVMNKKINCVIVKDLSRLSRNYSDAGSLIENLFVEMNVRFISLNENVDSYLNPDSVSNILIPITNVMNDNFCYQTSKKIRQVFNYKRRKGEHIGSFAVYGYNKNPEDKHTLIIDEEAAEVVRHIFGQFLDGMSKNAIVHGLNSCGILCPSEYKQSKGLKYQNPNGKSKSLWSPKTITDILKNRVYAGDMVQGRQRVKSYKVHTQESIPESEWFIVENTHEPIIDRVTFQKVQELLKRDTRTAPAKQKLYLFSGFLRCADCGKAMTRSKVKETVYYYCRTYKDQSKTACTKHTIKHDGLEAAVLYAIRQQVYLSACYSDIISKINSVPPKMSEYAKLINLINAKEKEISKVMRYKQSLYQDWKDGKITYKDYSYMNNNYDIQVEERKAGIEKLSQERQEFANDASSENPFLTAFSKNENIEELTRGILIELVDCIKIHENGNISVIFKFADEYLRENE